MKKIFQKFGTFFNALKEILKSAFKVIKRDLFHLPVLLAIFVNIAIFGGIAAWIHINAEDTKIHHATTPPMAESFIKQLTPEKSILEDQLATHEAEDTKVSNDYYRTPFSIAKKTPVITLIITNLGISEKQTENAILDLPYATSLALSPYSQKLDFWAEQSHIEKHETLSLLPMEPLTYPTQDPGQLALSTRNSTDENKENLEKLLKKDHKNIAYMNYMGDRFLTNRTKLVTVFRKLKELDATFVESPVTQKSVAPRVAAEVGLTYLRADTIIDKNLTRYHIFNELDLLEEMAKERGYAIGIAHSYPVTFDTINKWVQQLHDTEIKLAPLSTILERVKDEYAN